MRILATGVAAAALLVLGACSTLDEKRKIDYKSARSLPPLEVPKDLSLPPDIASAPAAERAPGGVTSYSAYSAEANRPRETKAAVAVLPTFENMRLVRGGNQHWLIVDGTPEELWPQVQSFLLSTGLLIAKENPQTGVLETDWAENRANVGGAFQRAMAKYLGSVYSTGVRDRYRVRLVRGEQPGTTDILIAHHKMEEEVYTESNNNVRFVWEPRPSDPELEVEMLRLLMVHLGVTPEDASQQVAKIQKAPDRAKLTRDEEGRNLLSLQENLDRAWRRVGLSLDRLGFTVEDRDRSKGVYYVRYNDPEKEKKKSWFSSETKKDDSQYQIALTSASAGTQVAVLDRGGEPERSGAGERILNLLYQQLK
ncbi:MAG: outer membrane protein assembly factor BamC [Pseudomonadota bacterium]|nr:MAG: outer membrane protein assembly factor BamC [Pseudomonadota bacterium]